MNNATENNKEYEDKRILVLDGKNRKLDVSDSLEKSTNWRRPITDKSKLCLTICDYTNKDKGGSVTAKFNFTPSEINEFDYIMRQVGDFKKSYDRIFNAPDEQGLSPVKKIIISRQARMQDGTPSKYPIYIAIENGKAKCNVTSTGMTNFSQNTYICNAKADIRLSYEDARTLFRESAEYIERMKMLYAMEIKGIGSGSTATSESNALSESKYTDGVNYLYKGIVDLMKKNNELLATEIDALKKQLKEMQDEIMFGKC